MSTIDPILTVFIVWGALSVLACGWAVIDAMRASADAWWRCGQSRYLWIALLIVAFCIGLAPLAVLAYLIVPFPAVRAGRNETSLFGPFDEPVIPGDSAIP